MCIRVCVTYSCQGLVKDWIERRVQVFLYILQQNRIPKLNGSLQHPQEVWHLKVDDFQALRISTHDHRSEKKHFHFTVYKTKYSP